jgi:hypothetical protein
MRYSARSFCAVSAKKITCVCQKINLLPFLLYKYTMFCQKIPPGEAFGEKIPALVYISAKFGVF